MLAGHRVAWICSWHISVPYWGRDAQTEWSDLTPSGIRGLKNCCCLMGNFSKCVLRQFCHYLQFPFLFILKQSCLRTVFKELPPTGAYLISSAAPLPRTIRTQYCHTSLATMGILTSDFHGVTSTNNSGGAARKAALCEPWAGDSAKWEMTPTSSPGSEQLPIPFLHP